MAIELHAANVSIAISRTVQVFHPLYSSCIKPTLCNSKHTFETDMDSHT